MRNPFRTEPDAFVTVVLASAVAVAVAIAAIFGGTWAALGVFLALALGLTLAARPLQSSPGRSDSDRPFPRRLRARGEERHEVHRLLVLANETLVGEGLHEEIRRRTSGRQAAVLVVAPVLNSKLRHWTSDTDGATHEARARLDRSLAALDKRGVTATGTIGADDPLQALEDALRQFAADEIVISTHPPSRSHWLERGLVSRARSRLALPITHVVVDLERERAQVEGVPAGAASA